MGDGIGTWSECDTFWCDCVHKKGVEDSLFISTHTKPMQCHSTHINKLNKLRNQILRKSSKNNPSPSLSCFLSRRI
ncbi:hypothetical protein VNO80_00414 [Phaseolus coccineus]|uniref:Uncharacterized protein n=1 Tax=Phaseolus coccineus TaxID=3886 RepID=A0AAN9P006_PHACN